MSNPYFQWYVCCGGPLLCPSFFEVIFPKSFSPFLFLSFDKVLIFYFLSYILLEISKCLISQNIGYFFETPLKTALTQFFRGVAHEQPWSSIVCFDVAPVGVFYCVQFFSAVIFLQNHSLHSFSQLQATWPQRGAPVKNKNMGDTTGGKQRENEKCHLYMC